MTSTINEEYLSYVDYLKSINFANILENLKKKYANKKIVLFGTGVLLDAILDNYNVTDYLNIIGVSDKRLESQQEEISTYKNINLYKPFALRALNISVVLDTSVLFENTAKYLRNNFYVKKSVEIAPMIQIPFVDKFKNFVAKQKASLGYLLESKNLVQSALYYFTLNDQELESKTNYLKKLNKIRNSNEPLKVAFLCTDITHTDFIGLYNLLKFDNDFKVFPIIITPKQLLESEEVSEESIQEVVDFFKTYDLQVIDGWDRETRTIPCIHAFKPDLVFYQKPIYAKDDFSPYVMSKQALTISVEYDTRNADFAALGAKYFRKQVSNMWKVFVNNEEDRKLYEEYTDITKKDVVKVVSKNINASIVKYLKNSLNR